MRSIKHRVTKLEKKQGKGRVFRFLTLCEGDPDPPETQDPDVFTMIVDLRQDRQDK